MIIDNSHPVKPMIKVVKEYYNTPSEIELMERLADILRGIVSWAEIKICGDPKNRTLYLDLDRVTVKQLNMVISVLHEIGEVEEIFGADWVIRISVRLNKR